MKKFYKLFIGESIQEGMPENATLTSVVTQDLLKRKVITLASQLKDGQDLYLVDDSSISAYWRDGLYKVFA